MRLRGLRGRRGVHSLRGKLTLANVALLAVGIAVATAVSLMTARFYLLDKVDTELKSARTTLGNAGFSLQQIESLSELGIALDRFTGDAATDTDPLPSPTMVYVAVDSAGKPVALGRLKPTPRQHALAAAAKDPVALAADEEPRDVRVEGDRHRVVGARLSDGTVVLIAMPTEGLHEGMGKALRMDLAVGTLLLALLGCLTMFSVRRRMQPLEDMVETSSAIAEGDLTRRVPSSREATLEVEQLRVALNSMLHQVESAYRTRERSAAQLRRFVGDASHELRTPLMSVRGYADLFQYAAANAPEERDRHLARLRAEAARMGFLLDDLLLLARLDAAEVETPLRPQEADLVELVEHAADAFRVTHADHPLAVAPGPGSLKLRLDPQRVRQVLDNLLTNAAMHTPPGTQVSVAVSMANGSAQVRIADAGPGIPPADRERVFDRFYRVDKARSRDRGGSGLGLAVAQSLVHAHGGRIDLTSEPGATVFTVTIPLTPGRLTDP
ncbi:HAMP domain-containing histidine kinase [Streptomyces sp. ISL-14]|nr:HAMP domain-containing histidine kinase [Streptomyces sp. ISL-14]